MTTQSIWQRLILPTTPLLVFSAACGMVRLGDGPTPTPTVTAVTGTIPLEAHAPEVATRPAESPGQTPTATVFLDPIPPAASSATRSVSTPPPAPVPTVTPRPYPTRVADFEGQGNTPDHWTTEQWQDLSTFAWEEAGIGRHGSRCISLQTSHPGGNDAAWTRLVDLEPGQWYNLSGWIKGETLENVSGSVTANICLMDTWESTMPASGTFDWTKEYLTFRAGETGQVRIGCRLGYWGSLATGKAYFDDLEITPLTRHEGQRHALVLEDVDLASSGIGEAGLAGWQADLDRAYDAYTDLVGDVPFSGQKIEIVSVRQNPGGWAVAGNPIRWHQPYVRDTLLAVRNGDWSFGMLHELGHDFDLDYRWVWDAEFMANFKMEYVVEMLDARIYIEEAWYQGGELRSFYADQYWQNRAGGKYDGTVLHYRLAELRDDYGWDLFKQAFREYLTIPEEDLPATRLDKFLRFIEILSAISGEDVKLRFDPGEWDWVISQLVE
jgi:hypothetical protein